MPSSLARVLQSSGNGRDAEQEQAFLERLQREPEACYGLFLERYSPVLLRMIHRFMRDADEVMEVYTGICERFRANDYQAFRRFQVSSELMPWMSVVVANACRDRFRKQKATSSPASVLKRLNKREQLVFRYYYRERMPHEDIAEVVQSKHGLSCTALDIVADIDHISSLLSIKKRWALLSALNANRPQISIDEMDERGIEPPIPDTEPDLDEALAHKEEIERLNAALEQLGDEDRLLVLLRYEQDLSAAEIAEMMHYESYKYVYTRLRTIAGRLRRLLGRV